MKRFTLVVLVLMLALMVSVVGAQEEKVLRIISGPDDVPTIDPSHSEDTQSNDIIEHSFTGLTRLNEVTGEIGPGMATHWELDGKVYTFHLMDGISWVRFNPDSGEVEQVLDADGNVRYVTAHDFVYGWQRTLDPELAAYYASVVGAWVEGGLEYNSGEGSVDDLAVVALDDMTLQITATNVTAFVPMVYGMWLVNPLPQWTIDENGDQWTEIGNYHTFGPFTVSEWIHDESITMVRNPFWPGTDNIPVPDVDKVISYMLDSSAAMDLYEADGLDVVAPPLSAMDRVRADPVLSEELVIGTDLCTYYYGFNVDKEPTNNVHLRRAFSMAIDRQSLIDNVTKGGQQPAQWFARPGLAAAPTMDTHPDSGIWYDADAAREELAMALEDLGLMSVDELPEITLMHNTSEGHAAIATAIQQMWVDELGIEVQVGNLEWSVFLDLRQNDAPQIFRSGWCPDYIDVHNFTSDVFRSDSANNDANYNSSEFDALVDAGATEADLDTRRDLYAQAEELLVYEDAAIAPIYWYTSVSLTRPNVERTYATIGQERYEKWTLGD